MAVPASPARGPQCAWEEPGTQRPGWGGASLPSGEVLPPWCGPGFHGGARSPSDGRAAAAQAQPGSGASALVPRLQPSGRRPPPPQTAPAQPQLITGPPGPRFPLAECPLRPPPCHLQPLPSSRDSALPVQVTTGPCVADHSAAADGAAGGRGEGGGLAVIGTMSGRWGTSPAPAAPPPLSVPRAESRAPGLSARLSRPTATTCRRA